MNILKVASWMIVTFMTFFTLVYGQSIIIPFVIALLIWFVVKKTRNLIDKSPFIRNYIPKWIKTVLASFLIFTGIFFIGKILTSNIESLTKSYDKYASNIESVSKKISELFQVNIHDEIIHFFSTFEFSGYLELLFNSISDILGNMVMIIFYITFLFIEESLFQHKIKLIFHERKKFLNVMTTIGKVDKSLSSYISLKSLISLMTTTLSYIILVSVGIDSPLFWAFLIFMFNFIPSVGPIMGTLFPAIFSLIQFGEFIPFLIIFFGVGGVATLVGSFVEPKLMGNTLNISPLVAILSLALWGSMWGIIGMFLSVPITVALIIIFSQFKDTRAIAILLSEKGRV